MGPVDSSPPKRKLARVPNPKRCLVVVEGLYSISGDVAPLTEIVKVCRDAGAYLMVDDLANAEAQLGMTP